MKTPTQSTPRVQKVYCFRKLARHCLRRSRQTNWQKLEAARVAEAKEIEPDTCLPAYKLLEPESVCANAQSEIEFGDSWATFELPGVPSRRRR